jgi:plasmid stabilization system protein ParE
MWPVRYLPAARVDFDESFNWYATQNVVSARQFVQAIDATLTRISTDPESFPLVDRHHRACSLRRFPFRIVYRWCDDHVLVVAVAHAKRRPGFWRHR